MHIFFNHSKKTWPVSVIILWGNQDHAAVWEQKTDISILLYERFPFRKVKGKHYC